MDLNTGVQISMMKITRFKTNILNVTKQTILLANKYSIANYNWVGSFCNPEE